MQLRTTDAVKSQVTLEWLNRQDSQKNYQQSGRQKKQGQYEDLESEPLVKFHNSTQGQLSSLKSLETSGSGSNIGENLVNNLFVKLIGLAIFAYFAAFYVLFKSSSSQSANTFIPTTAQSYGQLLNQNATTRMITESSPVVDQNVNIAQTVEQNNKLNNNSDSIFIKEEQQNQDQKQENVTVVTETVDDEVIQMEDKSSSYQQQSNEQNIVLLPKSEQIYSSNQSEKENLETLQQNPQELNVNSDKDEKLETNSLGSETSVEQQNTQITYNEPLIVDQIVQSVKQDDKVNELGEKEIITVQVIQSNDHIAIEDQAGSQNNIQLSSENFIFDQQENQDDQKETSSSDNNQEKIQIIAETQQE